MSNIFIVPARRLPSQRNHRVFDKGLGHGRGRFLCGVEDEDRFWSGVFSEASNQVQRRKDFDDMTDRELAIHISNQVFALMTSIPEDHRQYEIYFKYFWNRLATMGGQKDLTIDKIRVVGKTNHKPRLNVRTVFGREVRELLIGENLVQYYGRRMMGIVQLAFDFVSDDKKRANAGRLLKEKAEDPRRREINLPQYSRREVSIDDKVIDISAGELSCWKLVNYRRPEKPKKMDLETKIQSLGGDALDRLYDVMISILQLERIAKCHS